MFGELLDRGAIEYRRGLITIRDRRALELTACECYEQMTRSFQRLLPTSTRTTDKQLAAPAYVKDASSRIVHV